MNLEKNLFAEISRSPSFAVLRGRLFELFCIAHAEFIAHTIGFSAVSFYCGPYFLPPSKGQKSMQADLVFDRADNVLTLCEMKYTSKKPGVSLVREMDKKCEILLKRFPKKTIQPVLITMLSPTQDLINRACFYKILLAKDFIQAR